MAQTSSLVPIDAWYEISKMSWLDFFTEIKSHQFWVHLGPAFYENYRTYFLYFGLLYVPIVFGSVKLMENREPFKLGFSLTFWNFLMTIFSAWGAIYTLLPLWNSRIYHLWDPYLLVCDFWIFDQPTVSQLAVFFFVVSKVFEFIDTVFLVLRKRTVIFLHWYHHVITFLFTWYSNVTTGQHHNVAGFHFCLMNYFVHTFMYLYYMLVSMGIYPKWDLFITVIQLVQMVLGVIIITISMSCETADWTAILFGYILYASFFYLFIQIFKRRYLSDDGFRSTASRPSSPAPASEKKTQ